MPSAYGDSRLEQLLMERGMLAPQDLERVRQHPRRSEGLGRVLEALGILTEAQFLTLAAEACGTEWIVLARLSLDWAMAEALSFELCEAHWAVPVRLEGRTVVVAMADPGDLASVDTIRFRLGTRVRPVLAAQHEILDGIRRLFPEPSARRMTGEDEVVREAQTRGIAPLVDQRPEVEARLRQSYLAQASAGPQIADASGATPPVIHEQMASARLVNEVLGLAVSQGASHLRLDCFPDEVTLRFRTARRWGAPTALPGALCLWIVWHVKTLCGLPVGPLSRSAQALIPLPGSEGKPLWFRVFLVPARDGHHVLASPWGGDHDLASEVLWEPENPALVPWWDRLGRGAEALAAGRLEEAEEHFIASAELAEDLGPLGRVPLSETLSHLARAVELGGRRDDACALFSRALAVKEATLGVDSPRLVPLLSELGETLAHLGNLPEAVATLRRAVSLLELGSGPEDLEVAWLLERIGQLAAAQGRTQEAMDCMAEADALASLLLEGDPPGS